MPIDKVEDQEFFANMLIKKLCGELERNINDIVENFRKAKFSEIVRNYALNFSDHLGEGMNGLKELMALERNQCWGSIELAMPLEWECMNRVNTILFYCNKFFIFTLLHNIIL